MTTKTPVPFKEFSGIRNTVDARQIGPKDLAAAVNVDINDAKTVKRRPGRASFSAGAADSLYAHGTVALFRRSNSLRRLLDGGTSVEVLSGVNNPVNYWGENGRIYFSDGMVTGIYENGAVRGWGVIPPATLPTTAHTGGVMPPGRYMYAVTFLRADGEESGAGLFGVIEDGADGIAFSNLPISDQPAVTHKAIYITRPNGIELYRALVLENATTTASYSLNTNELGMHLETAYKQPPPAGRSLAAFSGRMLIGIGEYLIYTDAYRPERCDPVRQNYRFEKPVRLIAPVETGVYVGTDNQIVFLSGADISTASKTELAGYGAIPGTLAYTDGGNIDPKLSGQSVAMFASQKGICIGTKAGLINTTLNRYAYPASIHGAGMVRLVDGSNRFIAALRR
jgi:hypothetical protein